jgi:hypothetical protein
MVYASSMVPAPRALPAASQPHRASVASPAPSLKPSVRCHSTSLRIPSCALAALLLMASSAIAGPLQHPHEGATRTLRDEGCGIRLELPAEWQVKTPTGEFTDKAELCEILLRPGDWEKRAADDVADLPDYPVKIRVFPVPFEVLAKKEGWTIQRDHWLSPPHEFGSQPQEPGLSPWWAMLRDSVPDRIYYKRGGFAGVVKSISIVLGTEYASASIWVDATLPEEAADPIVDSVRFLRRKSRPAR